jgi:hypothetical protein
MFTDRGLPGGELLTPDNFSVFLEKIRKSETGIFGCKPAYLNYINTIKQMWINNIWKPSQGNEDACFAIFTSCIQYIADPTLSDGAWYPVSFDLIAHLIVERRLKTYREWNETVLHKFAKPVFNLSRLPQGHQTIMCSEDPFTNILGSFNPCENDLVNNQVVYRKGTLLTAEHLSPMALFFIRSECAIVSRRCGWEIRSFISCMESFKKDMFFFNRPAQPTILAQLVVTLMGTLPISTIQLILSFVEGDIYFQQPGREGLKPCLKDQGSYETIGEGLMYESHHEALVERKERFEFPTLYDTDSQFNAVDEFWFPFYPYWFNQTADLNVDIPFVEQRYYQNQTGLLGVSHPLIFETEDDTDHSMKMVDYLQVVTEKQMIRTSTLRRFIKQSSTWRETLEQMLDMLQLGSKQPFTIKWFMQCLLKEFCKVILFGDDTFSGSASKFDRNILSHSSLVESLRLFNSFYRSDADFDIQDYVPYRDTCYCSGLVSHCAQSTEFGYYLNKQNLWSGYAITKGIAWLYVGGRIEIDNQYFPRPHPNHKVFRSTGAFAGKLIDGSL